MSPPSPPRGGAGPPHLLHQHGVTGPSQQRVSEGVLGRARRQLLAREGTGQLGRREEEGEGGGGGGAEETVHVKLKVTDALHGVE